MFYCLVFLLCFLNFLETPVESADPELQVETTDAVVRVLVGDTESLRYVYRDPDVGRPYFVPVRTTSGVQVSRNHPPQADLDKTDHLGLHTGIWLSFGDLNGHDYWRLKARTEHVRFESHPERRGQTVHWSVLNRYLSTDGTQAVCEETAHYSVQLVPQGYLLDLISTFRPLESEIVFGDQEEMGLGIRVNTLLSVERGQGGRLLDNEGRRNGMEVWGKSSAWCDYAGPMDEKWVGMALFSSPENFRPSWNHARDYGFLAVNPFGRAAFTQGAPSRVVVPPGESLTLRFGVYVHESATEADCPMEQVYKTFVGTPPRKSN